ncbi:MAG: DUF2490 domain-containing protein [Bacteroidaceae bacterium]|nr:DUF2490 domain-containing protein [Bacteroidaceae bacterium]
MRKYIFAFVLLAPCSLPLVLAQESNDEVGIWSELGIEKAITKSWDVGLDLEYRAQDRARFSAGLGTSYKLNKNLKFGLSYSFLYSERPEKYKEKSTKDEDPDNYYIGYNLTPEYWFPRHRFSVEATGSIKLWSCLKISLRERYQLTHCRARSVDKMKYRQQYKTVWDFIEDPDDPWNWEMVEIPDVPDGDPTQTWETEVKPAYTDQVLRSRLKLEFDKKRNPFSPFVSAEFHNSVSRGDRFLLQKIRTSAGISYKFRKHNEVSLAYILTFDMYDIEEDETTMTLQTVRLHDRMHAINIGYKYSF